MAFFQELTETVRVLERSALVATLPSSAPYGEEGERVLHQLQQIFGRMEAIYTPEDGEEIYEVIRRRLFEEIRPDEARRTADAYWEMYQRLGEDIPREAREPAYRDRLRTRGVLRLLAEIVADRYRNNDTASLILPGHIDLSQPAIRREFLKHIGNEFEGVIASDIAGPGARAPRIDQEMGSEYARFRVASALA
ncbi:MAG: ATP-binding protein, partial [Anaerolineae bacterium]|nr:ATP-binding protein [Anaerolineae bacterium]